MSHEIRGLRVKYIFITDFCNNSLITLVSLPKLPVKEFLIHQYGYFYNGLNLDDQQAEPCIPQKDLFYNGLYYTPTGNIWDGDLSNLLSVRSQMSL